MTNVSTKHEARERMKKNRALIELPSYDPRSSLRILLHQPGKPQKKTFIDIDWYVRPGISTRYIMTDADQSSTAIFSIESPPPPSDSIGPRICLAQTITLSPVSLRRSVEPSDQRAT